MSKQSKDKGNSNSTLIKIVLVALLVLIVLVILLLLRSCQGQNGDPSASTGAGVFAPDYPGLDIDPGAQTIPSEPPAEAPSVSPGGGSVPISFSDSVTYTISTGKLSLFYQNHSSSTHNMVVQVILVRGDDEYLLAQSGILEPGYQVTSLTADENAPKLSKGGYDGLLRLRFYDPATGNMAMVDTDIPCVITVKE